MAGRKRAADKAGEGGADGPTIVKKYANRRLYDTSTSRYVTLEDLAQMVREGRDFVVQDAKSGEDITRPVLGQIIFEQEAKDGPSLLPTEFLRQIISYYGDQMGAVVPSYLEQSMAAFQKSQDEMREQMTRVMGGKPPDPAAMMGGMASAPLKMIEEQTRRNAEMFSQAMRAFSPFGMGGADAARPAADANDGRATGGRTKDGRTKDGLGQGGDELDELRAQIAAMQRKVDDLGK